MRSKSTGTGGEDAVRGLRLRRCVHGKICRDHDERPLSSRDDVPDERVRVQSRQTGEDEQSTAELVRRSVCKYPTTLYLNLHETHFSFIQDARMYCHSYICRKCNSLWTHAWKLRQHESTCTGGVRRVFPGGVYHSTPSVFERLDDENIRVAESLRYYPYRATFDFECWFDTEHLPSDSSVHWIARHVPLSVSVASNVPGHERVKCLVTNGNTKSW